MKTLAVDFGTSTTYVATCPGHQLLPEPVSFFDGRWGVDTSLLVMPRGTLIGSQALEAFASLEPDRREGVQFWTRFKPQLGTLPDAAEGARRFLRELLSHGRSRHLHLLEDATVIFGVPCQASDAYADTLRQVAQTAGFGQVKLLEEPLAVLASALGGGLLPPAVAAKGGLVIDFGGGTCDLARVEGLQARDAGGDWTLGGRLFDDLFYTLWAEQNPQKAEDLSVSDRAFIRLYWARVLKERFSQAMAQDPTQLWIGSAGNWGGLRDLTWDEVMERARSYEPTDGLRRDVPTLPPRLDLIGRFEALLDGLEEPPRWVLLSGGSSQWPFVTQAVATRWPEARLQGLPNPGGAVAAGLAMLPALTIKASSARAKLIAGLPALSAAAASSGSRVLKERLQGLPLQSLAQEMTDRVLLPALKEWAQKGGTLQQLQDETARRAQLMESLVEHRLEEFTVHWAEQAGMQAEAAIKDWFADRGFEGPDRLAGLTARVTQEQLRQLCRRWSEQAVNLAWGPLRNALTLVAGVGSGVAGMMFGGPVPAAAAALGGALLAALATAGGPLKDRLVRQRLSPRMTRRLADDGALIRVRRHAEASLQKLWKSAFEQALEQGLQTFEEQIGQALACQLDGFELVAALEAK